MMKQLENLYAHFERMVAGLLLTGMAVVIVLAAFSFLRMAFTTSMGVGADMEYSVFQALFDRLLAAVIALELAHSVHLMVTGRRGFVQVRAVLVIGILAVVRKLILIDFETTSGMILIGLAAAIIALGSIFTLLNWLENRSASEKLPSPGASE